MFSFFFFRRRSSKCKRLSLFISFSLTSVTLLAIGIGKRYSKSELLIMVGNDSEKVVGAKSFEDLVRISGNISKMVCKEGIELVSSHSEVFAMVRIMEKGSCPWVLSQQRSKIKLV